MVEMPCPILIRSIKMSDVSFVSLEHICKSFGGVPVLKDVDFDLKEG